MMARWRYFGKFLWISLTFSSVAFNCFLLFRNFLGPMNLDVNQEHMLADDVRSIKRLDQSHQKVLVEVDQENQDEILKSAPEVKVQDLRKKTLLQACTDLEFEEHPSREHNLTSAELTSLKNTFVIDKHKLLFCYIPKVSCTSWKHLFLVSYQIINPEIKHKSVHTEFERVFMKVGRLAEKDANRKIKDYKQFLFVRNPFSRVLSAYREKIEFKNPSSPHQNYYPNFITRWLKKHHLGHFQRRNNTAAYSFPEFVRYFIARRIEDEHWNDQYNLCQPCLVEYDFIGKYETLQDDVERFLGTVPNGSSMVFPKADPQKYTWHSSSDENMSKYYQKIRDNDFKSLVECLYPDLRLFGYSIPTVIQRPWLKLSSKYTKLVDVG
nr:carbohydrate sulfotransferase 11-like isoform X1 [Lytechinus pictus]